MLKHKLARGFLILLLAGAVTAGCGKAAVDEKDNSDQSAAGAAGQTSPALSYFSLTHPGKEVIKSAAADLNGDSNEDLVVIYRENEEKNRMVVVLGRQDDYICTNETPAPVSNQVITFKDIDDKPPLEFIVQGMKGANVGYGIFRVEGDLLEDLFGEGMRDCC